MCVGLYYIRRGRLQLRISHLLTLRGKFLATKPHDGKKICVFKICVLGDRSVQNPTLSYKPSRPERNESGLTWSKDKKRQNKRNYPLQKS